MNKKIMMSGLSIISALTLLGGTAFAAFTTSAVAQNSTFSSSAESLTVSSDNNTYLQTITSPFVGTNVNPGYNHTFTFFLKNEGPDSLDISATFAGGSSSILEDVLSTDFSCDNGANPPAASVTAMRSGSVSLGTLASGVATTCTMQVTLPFSVDNNYQNLNSAFNAIFNASQTAL